MADDPHWSTYQKIYTFGHLGCITNNQINWISCGPQPIYLQQIYWASIFKMQQLFCSELRIYVSAKDIMYVSITEL
jgi:hypothetical protein